MLRIQQLKKWSAVNTAALLVFALFAFTKTSAAGLNGTYTIDPSKPASATNYTSFNDADSDLSGYGRSNSGTANGPGVSGAVTFSVANGTYLEQVIISAISGASATNTITFQSASKDSSKVILLDSTAGGSSGSPGFVLHLDNASFIHFYGITFQKGADLGGVDFVVIIDDQSDSNIFSNCQILGNQFLGATQCVLIASTGSSDNYNAFYNNYMKDAYDGIFWAGVSGTGEVGNIFDHNIIDSISVYLGFAAEYQDNLTFTNNKVNMINGYYGIYMYGINVSGTTSPTSLVANNFVTEGTNTVYGVNYGIAGYDLDKTNIVNNSVNIYGSATGATYAGFFQGASTSAVVNVNNNILYNVNTAASDYGLYATNIKAEDYDDIKTGGKSLVNYNGTVYATLATWRTSPSGFGKHDSTINPLFNSNADLHANNASLKAGSPLAYNKTDIDGDTRNATTPDMGADEFIVLSVKPIISAITSPPAGFCVGTLDVNVVLKNYGFDTLKMARISWTVNGVLQTPFLWTGIIVPYATLNVKIGTFNFSSSTLSYNIVAFPDSANNISVKPTSSNTALLTVRAGLASKTYTIDNSGTGTPDYTSFRAVANDLNNKGVCGAVIFSVANGIYNEQLTINAIPGSTAANTVTFISKSHDSSKVILDTASIGVIYYGYTLGLFGASYISFKQMTISDSASTFTNGIEIGDGAIHTDFENDIIRISTTTSSANYAIYDYNTIDNYLTFKNNHITGGEVGIFAVGSGANEKGLVIVNNIIDSVWEYGILTEYQDSFTISKNVILAQNAVYGLYLYNNNTIDIDTSIISNNFISGLGYGMYIYYPSKLRIYDNSIYNNASTVNTEIYGTTGNTVDVLGNIFANAGGGDALDINTTTITFKNCNYNDLYTTGSILGTYNGTACSTLAAWRSASGKDKSSVSGDPAFKSPSTGDLHFSAKSVVPLHDGIAIPSTPDDIDGEKRSAVPNIGADETKLVNVDIATLSIDSPAVGFCNGPKDVYARILNAGTDTLTSATISWSVNGVTMTSFSWTGSLPFKTSTLVNLGSVAFTSGTPKLITAWSTNPNGITGTPSGNDTTTRMVGMGLPSGTYTIGGTTPNYISFHAAVNDLVNFGVCGAVTYNVRDGSYNESVLIKSVAGTSNANTVIFQSQSLDSTKVILDTANASTAYAGSGVYTVRIEGAQHITFRKMTIMNTLTVTYGSANVIELANKASYIKFENNILSTSVTTGNYGAVVWDAPSTVESHNTFRYNQMSGGYFGFNIAGLTGGKAFTEASNVIYDNIIDSIASYGIYATYQDSMAIIRNNIFVTGNSGLFLNNFTSSFGANNIINNFVTVGGTYTYGIYSNTNAGMNIFYNSVNTSSPSTTYYGAAFFTGSSVKIILYNNIFNNDAGGLAIYSSNSITTSNYNDLFSNGGTNLGYWNGTSCVDLKAWRAASSGKDKNSISADPLFFDPTNGDLHETLTSPTKKMGNFALTSAITTDIDGQLRNTATPDIGADEKSIDSNDIGVAVILNPIKACGNASTPVTVIVSNYGINDQTKFNIHVSVNGTMTSTVAYSGTLNGLNSPAPHSDTITIAFSPVWNTTAGGMFDIIAYTDLTTDANLFNDTAKALADSILPALKPTIKGNISACANSSQVYTAGTTTNTYTWTTIGGTITAGAGTNSITVTWGSAGADTVKMIENNGSCSASTTYAVTVNAGPVVNFKHSNPCPGVYTTFTDSSVAGSGSLKSYSWDFGNSKGSKNSKDSTIYSPSIYTVWDVVTNSNGCKDSAKQVVTVNAINANFTHTNLGTPGQVSFVASDKTLKTYVWDFGDASAKGSLDSTAHTYNTVNHYWATLTVTDANNCSAVFGDTVIVLITGIANATFDNINVNVYPNPFKDFANISYSIDNASQVKVEVLDVLGRTVNTLVNNAQVAGEYNVKFTAGNNPAGIYIVRMTIGDNVIMRQITLVR